MLIFNRTPSINRLLIILILGYINENKPKINLLLTCKFFYKLRFNIFYYEKIRIRTVKDINKRFMNVEINGYGTNSSNINKLLHSLDQDLKCLSLQGYCYVSKKKSKRTQILILKKFKFIKCLNVDTNFFKLSANQVKKLILKNITCLKFNNFAYCDILKEYPLLKKITIKYDSYNNFFYWKYQISKISNVLVCFDCSYEYDNDYHFDQFEKFVSNIPHTATSLIIKSHDAKTNGFMPAVPKLIIRKYCTDQPLPTNIGHIRIKKIIMVDDKLLVLPINVKKLTIGYDDKKFLDSSIDADCVKYKY